MGGVSDLQLADLIDEIACAMRIDTPVLDSMQRLRTRRLGRVATTAGQVADRLQRGVSLGDAVAEIKSPIAGQVGAAIAAVQRGGDCALLERLARLIRHRHHTLGSMRLGYFYPLVLLLIAYLSLVMVAAPLVHDHRGRDMTWSPTLTSTLAWMQTNAWTVPLVLIAGSVGIVMLLRWRQPLSRHSRISLFCHSLADQIDAGVVESDAIKNSAAIARYPSAPLPAQPSFAVPAVANLIDGAPGELAKPNVMAARLRYSASRHSELARRSDYIWSRLVPRLAMLVVGCGFILGYAWFIIAPVYQQVARW